MLKIMEASTRSALSEIRDSLRGQQNGGSPVGGSGRPGGGSLHQAASAWQRGSGQARGSGGEGAGGQDTRGLPTEAYVGVEFAAQGSDSALPPSGPGANHVCDAIKELSDAFDNRLMALGDEMRQVGLSFVPEF